MVCGTTYLPRYSEPQSQRYSHDIPCKERKARALSVMVIREKKGRIPSRTNMLRASPIFVFVLLLCTWLNVRSSCQERPSTKWKPGEYKGLRTGASTGHEVLLKLGKPKLKTVPEGPNDPALRKWHYELRESRWLCCDVLLRGDVVQEITLDLSEVEQSEATRMFGGTFTKIRFSSRATQVEGGSAPICEDPDGDMTLLLNPTEGLYFWLEPDGKVSSATFSSSRPGVGKCSKRR